MIRDIFDFADIREWTTAIWDETIIGRAVQQKEMNYSSKIIKRILTLTRKWSYTKLTGFEVFLI